MSLVRRGLTGVIIGLCRTVLKNGEANMRNSHLLSHNYNRTMMPVKMKANGNFSDASVERLYSVTINRMMSPSNAVDLGPEPDKRVGGPGQFFLEGPYDVSHDVIVWKSCVFAYSQGSRLFFPVVENVLTRQMHIQLAARREFMI